MLLGFGLLFAFAFVVWIVFFKFKWLTFSIPWAIFSSFFVLHLLLIFLIGMRFVTPASNNAKVVQHTIQITPRLTEPTLVTAVLVEPNQPVKKGQPLFQFDRRPYQLKVNQLEAQLAQANGELEYAKFQQQLSTGLASKKAGSEEDAQKGTADLQVKEATVKKAVAELDLARYYLDNTTIVAPEDGHITNLQVRPGMVAGDVRFGAIASFICDDGRYLLAAYYQEILKYVAKDQPVEIALDLYPGQIFRGKVQSIWMASGEGQYLPSGTLPLFQPYPPKAPQGCFAVVIVFDDPDQSKFPIGAQGVAAIYTEGMKGSWAALRRISIRITSWFNFLYPMPF
jgi:multidrug resistance efflux pump